MAYMPGTPGYGTAPGVGEGEEYELRPAGDLVYNVDDATEKAIVDWRTDCFERYGFSETVALAMATRRDVDRGQVQRLIDEGAAPDVVAAIVL